MNKVSLMIPPKGETVVRLCNCVLFIIYIALSLSMNCLLSTLQNMSTFSIYIYLHIYYKQNTITNPYRLFHPLGGSSRGPKPTQ